MYISESIAAPPSGLDGCDCSTETWRHRQKALQWTIWASVTSAASQLLAARRPVMTHHAAWAALAPSLAVALELARVHLLVARPAGELATGSELAPCLPAAVAAAAYGTRVLHPALWRACKQTNERQKGLYNIDHEAAPDVASSLPTLLGQELDCYSQQG